MADRDERWNDAGRNRLLFEQHPDPMFELDADGRFVAVNAAFVAMAGQSEDLLLGIPYAPLVHPEDRERSARELQAALSGEVRHYELRVGDPADPIVLAATKLPVLHDGEVIAVYGIARDITEGRRAQAALEESERRFRGFFEGASAGMAIVDRDGRFVDANPSYQRMLGYDLDELRQLDVVSITHPEDRESTSAKMYSVLTGTASHFQVEKRYLSRSGEVVWVRVSVSPILDAEGQPLHNAATVEDITSAKLAEEGLRRSETLRRMAGQLALVGGWAVDAADLAHHWSEELQEILDAPAGHVPPLDQALALYAPEDRERVTAALQTVLADGRPVQVEAEIDTFAGRRIPVRVTAEGQRREDGTVERVYGALQDLTELRASSARTAELARQLSATFETMTDAVMVLDTDWVITYVNRRTEERLGLSRDAFVGRNFWTQFPEMAGTELEGLYRRAMVEQSPARIEAHHFAPLDMWVEINIAPHDGGIALYFTDITDRHRALDALRQRERLLERQAALLDEAQDAIIVQDLQQRITYWNRSAERVYGWSQDEVMGRDIRELMYEDPDQLDRGMAVLHDRGAWSGEVRHRHRDGTPLVVDARMSLLTGDDGTAEGVLGINTDVTAQRAVEQQLLRAQRMESLGTLAGGVAHDLNNVLSPILLASELLQLDQLDDQQMELLRTIHRSAQRGSALVSQVLSFARGVEGVRIPVDVGHLLADVRAIVRETFPKNIEVLLDVSSDIGTVTVDSTQIQQVLLNLAVNARDAMPAGGQLTISASDLVLDAHYVSARPDATPGRYLLIAVEDSGVGMTAEVRDRIFEPFFTTKAQGAGTGLGLSTATAVVRSHGGHLHVYSEPGRGTTFHLYLPRSSDGPAAPAVSDDEPAPRGRGQTVLVIDDEPAVRSLTRQTLETHGYRVLEAADGAEAMTVFAAHHDEVAIVLTDMMMPVMDGTATIHALKRIDPDVRIIGCSGLHEAGRQRRIAGAGADWFLPKPFSSGDLLTMVATVLHDDR